MVCLEVRGCTVAAGVSRQVYLVGESLVYVQLRQLQGRREQRERDGDIESEVREMKRAT